MNAAARANPPPNSSKMPQGTFLADSQFNANACRERGRGMTNRSRAAAMAIAASLRPGRKSDNPGILTPPNTFGARRIHARAVVANTARIYFSAPDRRPRLVPSASTTEARLGRLPLTWNNHISNSQHPTSIGTETSMPTTSQLPNPTSIPSRSLAAPANIAFGGVPISVATPPMEQA